jgi:hypothetical protein
MFPKIKGVPIEIGPTERADHAQRLRAAGYTPAEIRTVLRLWFPDETPPLGKRGRRVKWTQERNIEFYKAVRMKLADGGSVLQVCNTLAKRAPWREIVASQGKKQEPGELLRRHYELLSMGQAIVRGQVDDAGDIVKIESVEIRPPRRRKSGGKYSR